MKILLTNAEFKSMETLAIKLNAEKIIEKQTNELTMYDYLQIDVKEDGVIINFHPSYILKGMKVLNLLAPKVMQCVAMLRSVYELSKALFSKEAMQEMYNIGDSMGFANYTLEVDKVIKYRMEDTEVKCFCKEELSEVQITEIIKNLKKIYEEKTHLQNTKAGRNICDAIYSLEQEIRDRLK